MAKKRVAAIVKIQIPAGKASPAPPVGTALGPHGVAIMDFVKAYNAATEAQTGTIVPVEITVFEDRTFTFVLKTPPTPVLLREKAGLDKASKEPGKVERRQGHRGPGRRDRRDQDAATSTPTTSRPPSSRCAAPPVRWASTSSPERAASPHHTTNQTTRNVSTGSTSPGELDHEGDITCRARRSSTH